MQFRPAVALAAVFPWIVFSPIALGDSLAPKADEIASPITDHFALRAIVFDAKASTNLRLDPSAGTPLGTPVNAEQILGLNPDNLQGRLELIFRLRERSRLRMDFFRLERDGAVVLKQPLTLGNYTFATGSHVISAFNWRLFGLTYTYSFVRTERFELAGGVGAHFLQAEASGQVRALNERTDDTGVAGFPSLALDGTWRISKRFAATVRGQYFGATVSHLHGRMTDAHADVQYRWRRNVAFGVGYASLDSSVDSTASNRDLQGRFDLKVTGPEAFFRVSF